MQIDHHHKQTRVAFFQRTNRLKEADVWFPLTINEEWVALNSNLLFIWDFLSVTYSDFAAIVTCHDDLWYVSGRQSWAKILINWGLEIAPKIEKHNKINWVNFIGSGGGGGAPARVGVLAVAAAGMVACVRSQQPRACLALFWEAAAAGRLEGPPVGATFAAGGGGRGGRLAQVSGLGPAAGPARRRRRRGGARARPLCGPRGGRRGGRG